MKLSLFLLALASLSAQDKPKPLPSIAPEQQRDYLVTQAAYERAMIMLDNGLTAAQKQLLTNVNQALQDLQTLQQQLANVCGDAQQLTSDQKGVPFCGPKAAPAPPAK